MKTKLFLFALLIITSCQKPVAVTAPKYTPTKKELPISLIFDQKDTEAGTTHYSMVSMNKLDTIKSVDGSIMYIEYSPIIECDTGVFIRHSHFISQDTTGKKRIFSKFEIEDCRGSENKLYTPY